MVRMICKYDIRFPKNLEIVSLKNNMRIVKKGLYYSLGHSSALQTCMEFLTEQFSSIISANPSWLLRCPVDISIRYRVSSKRRRDTDSIVSTVIDCMVESGCLLDDNIFLLRKITAKTTVIPMLKEDTLSVLVTPSHDFQDNVRAGFKYKNKLYLLREQNSNWTTHVDRKVIRAASEQELVKEIILTV